MYKYIRDIISQPYNHLGKLWMFAVVMVMSANISVLADTPENISTLFGSASTYTITSASNHQMYAASSNATSLSQTSTANATDANYLFAFVSDDNGHYYLYNVGTKSFVASVTGNTTAFLRDGNSTLSPVYVYKPSVNNAGSKETYCYAIAFDNANATFASSAPSNTLSNTNDTNHVLAITNNGANITDWNFLGGGGNYSLNIARSTVAFTSEDLAEAKSRLKAYTAENLHAAHLDSTKVYTLKNANGTTLTVNSAITTSNGSHFQTYTLSATNSPAEDDAHTWFSFVTDPTDATKVYLYNVGTKTFVTSNGTTMSRQVNTSAAQVYLYNSNNADYPLAISKANAWAANGNNNLVVNGTTASFANNTTANTTNQFLATEVANATGYNLAWPQSNIKNNGKLTLEEAGLSQNKTYSLISQRAGLFVNSRLTNNADTTSTDASHQFVFVTTGKTGEENTYYLYSVSAGQYVNKDGSLASGKSDPIYIFSSADNRYPFMFTFTANPTWNTSSGNAGNGNVIINTGANLNLNTWSVRDDGNMLKAKEQTEFTDSMLAHARIILNGYTESSFDAEKLTTDNTVYTFSSEDGGKLYANANGVTKNADAKDNDVNAQFVFYTDTTNNKVYLYSVGQERFISQSMGLTSGTAVSSNAVTVYKSNDEHGYNVAFKIGNYWLNTASATAAAAPSVSNRFKVTAVANATYDKTMPRDIIDNKHRRVTLEEAGLSSSAVYYITSERATWYSDGQLRSDQPTTVPNNTQTTYQFAFFTDQKTGKVYLYNVGSNNFLNKNELTGRFNGDRGDSIFIYRTNNPTYPYLLSFNNNLTDFNHGGEGAVTYYVVNGAQPGANNTFSINNYSRFDAGNQVRFVPISGATYNQEVAQRILDLPAGSTMLNGPFHFRGASGNAFKSNGMQDVAEVNYYYYVDTRRQQYGTKGNSSLHAVDLQLPFKRYLNRGFDDNHTVLYTSTKQNYTGSPDHDNASNGNNYEPKGYIRWYNYHTDSKMSDAKLIPWNASDNNQQNSVDGSANRLSGNYYDQNGKPLGLIAHGLTNNINPNAAKVGTAYIIPEQANDSTWAGDTIACDVSFYTDFNVPMKADGTVNGDYSTMRQNLGTFNHEPTLSTRYVFHILPAKKIANQLRTALLTPVRGHTTTYGDRGIFSFGAKDKDATMALRIPLPDVPYFYFWPLNNPDSHHVYHKNNDKHGITESDITISGEPEEAAYIEYRVYSADSTMWRTITTDRQKMINISVNMLNGNDWKDLEGNPVDAAKAPKIEIGSTCFLVGYVVNADQTKKCPFFNSRLDISNNSPLSSSTLAAGGYPNRTKTYMESHFGSPIAQFTFDTENTGLNATAPTGNFKKDEVSNIPYDFSKRDYSFLYLRDLVGYKDDGTPQTGGDTHFRNLGYNDGAYVLHGDYDLVKQMSIGNDKVGYDMLHEREPSQYGYFMYTDASDESRSLGSQDFQGSLCSGSQIIVSAWVRNGSGAKYVDNNSSNNINAAPELRFTLLGVNKDRKNHDISTHEFAALCSGDFDKNIDGFEYTDAAGHVLENTSNWYQVYGAITLPANSGIENYTDFRIVIDNFCNTADGADYAIDDIFVYQSNSKLEVIQDPALCNDTEEASNDVKIKIRANYSSARQLTGAAGGDKKVYYRFCMPESATRGIPVTGKDFYGEGMDSYGVAIVPQEQTDTAQLRGSEGSGPRFETDASGIQDVILINRSFNLKQDSTYYVSIALDDGGKPGSWGLPSNLCSFYSSYFNLIRQDIYFNGTTATTKQITIPCGSSESSDYSGIRASITAPSHIGTGSVTLTNVPFHWYLGSIKDYNNVSTTDQTGKKIYLADAVQAYVDKYPGQAFNAANATEETGYTDAYKQLIQANLYTKDNTKGKLLMNAVDSLGTIPLQLGRDTITAVVAEVTAVVNNISYTLCPDPMQLELQVSQNGPGLSFGMKDVVYPSSESVRNIRIGLPQLKKMKDNDGTLTIPVREVSYEGEVHDDEELKFLGYKDDDSATDSIYISYTNDPSIDLTKVAQTYFGQLTSTTLAGGAANIQMKIHDYSMLHEGYEYTLMFKYKSTNYPKDATTGNLSTGVQCPGETYLRLRIVPEYVTWTPTVDNGLNSNWNNDGNWTRSTAEELYRADYEDYRKATYQFSLHDKSGNVVKTEMNKNVDTKLTESSQQPASFVPMYFTKVLIPTMRSQRYPMLGYIAHQTSNGLVQNLMNYKQHDATENIRYDMMASPSNNDSTAYTCVNFDGNVCEQIHFKTGAQLRNEQYLKYEKAWTELALPFNVWGTFTTPMHHSIAADMYVPKITGMQTTPLFEDIRFTDVDAVDENGNPWKGEGTMYGLYGKAGDTMYNRVRMPVYQKLWGEDASMQTDSLKDYSAYDNPYQLLIYPQPADDPDMSMHEGVNANNYNAWSHTFNFLANPDAYDHAWEHSINGIYDDAYGVAGKIGDEFTTPSETVNPTNMAVMRLPKADTKFSYYKTNSDGTTSPGLSTIDVTKLRDKNYRLGVEYNPSENDLGEVDLTTATLQPMAWLAWVADEQTEDGYPNYIKNNVGNIVFAKTQDDFYDGIKRQADGSIAASDTTSNANGLVYDLVGNPYTSAISVREFIRGNQEIFRKVHRDGQWVYRIWSLVGDHLYEYNDSNANTVIAPGQSIFIRIQRPGIDVVHFTTRMQADPNITEGSLAKVYIAPEPAKIYSINDNSDLTNIIEHGVDTKVYVWSPFAGTIAVSGETIRRVEIYSVDGQLIDSSDMSGSEKQFTVGSGIYIVRATLKDGKQESHKVAVK